MSASASPPEELAGYGIETVIDERPRCTKCDKVILWYAARPWSVQCRRCRTTNRSPGAHPGAHPDVK